MKFCYCAKLELRIRRRIKDAMHMYTPQTPITEVYGIGKSIASRLKRLEIATVADLLFYFPVRYDDFSVQSSISALQPGQATTVRGVIELLQTRKSFRSKKTVTEAIISDTTGKMKVIWFNQPFIQKNIHVGQELFFSGKVDVYHQELLMKGPQYEAVQKKQLHTASVIPQYSLTANITQKQLRTLMRSVIGVADTLEEYLPEVIRETYQLPQLNHAIRWIHFPSTYDELDSARKRFAFEEVFFVQLNIHMIRSMNTAASALPVPFFSEQTKTFVASLPFVLTEDQRRASWEILQDMQKTTPMNRLLEGDVGSGKTICAAIAAHAVHLARHQVALMAPTEVLATQHFETFKILFKESCCAIALLTASQKIIAKNGEVIVVKRKQMLDDINTGEVSIVIGTHALIQDDVRFSDLALAVIDEQHRFGVGQRKKLRMQSGTSTMPHLLSMSATPIPRTLSLIVYGDLDLSLIRQMPQGRLPIITRVVDSTNREKTYAFIEQEVKHGRQVFVICPLIDPSDKLGTRSVKEEFAKLDKIFPQFTVAMLHGKLKPADKQAVMDRFKNKDVDILVATSVVEVGVDIPNASVMMIEGAERFGLAQLHQFRGRVGRGTHQAYCFLFPSEDSMTEIRRLSIMKDVYDGLELAQKDLELRGPGAVYGVQQSGIPEFKIADITDLKLIQTAQTAARLLIEKDPDLGQFPALRDKVAENVKGVHFE